MAQDEVALQGRAAQVEVAVLHPQVIAAVRHLFDGEGRGLRLVEDGDLLGRHLDVARGHLGVLRRTFDYPARDLDDELAAQSGRSLAGRSRRVLLDDNLGDAVAVAQVDEGHRTEISHFLHPPCQGDALVDVSGSQTAARMGSVHGDMGFVFV